MPVLIASLILVAVFIAPALAIYPRLLQLPVTAVCIPIVSSLIVFGCVFVLVFFHSYTVLAVDSLSVIFILLAAWRLFFYNRRPNFLWQQSDFYILIINVAIILPLIVLACYSAFSTSDEIYSWGLWAYQHYHGEEPTYLITSAVYPQFFPIIISYCEKLLGNTEMQGPIKMALMVFPLVILQAIATSSKKTAPLIFIYLPLVFISVFPNHLYLFYRLAFADPMLIASLIASVALFIQYLESDNNYLYLWLAVCCGITAALTKQPGLLWALLIFPGWLLLRMIRMRKINHAEVCALVAMMYPPLLWLVNTGLYFFKNVGVIHESMLQRSVSQQLSYAVTTFFWHIPLVLLLFVITGLVCLQKKIYGALFWVLILPYVLIWFIFGAYDIRLGVHATALCGLIFAHSDYGAGFFAAEKLNLLRAHYLKRFCFATLTISILVALIFLIKVNFYSPYPIYPLEGGRTTANVLYEKDGDFVYKNLYANPNIMIWLTDPFNYGLFYGHTAFIFPATENSKGYQVGNLLQDLRRHQPDYLIDPGKAPSYYNQVFATLIQQCPQVFSKVAQSSSKYNFVIYRLRKEALPNCNFQQ